jgi:hypothetical protein
MKLRDIAVDRPLVLLGGGIVVLTTAALAWHIPGADTVGTDLRKVGFVATLAIIALLYLLAVHRVLRRPAIHGAIWFVLAAAMLARLPPLLDMPFLSSDVYRYVWDGRVQVAGFNPYSYIPADPALQPLRDTAIYPYINRANYAPTIYPPAAQLVFQAVAWVSQSVLAMKLAMVAFEALAIGAVLAMLRMARLPPERVLIYAWNPLSIWAFAGNGHVDAIAIGFLAVALLARGLKRDTLAGALLGAAVLVKMLPIVVAPALWRGARSWRAVIACVAVIIGLYLCYVGAGWGVFGFLPGYAAEEDLTQGSGIWLLAGLGYLIPPSPLEAKLYAVGVAVGLAALGAWIAFRPRPSLDPARDIVRVCGDAALLAAVVTVAISPHYPWYFAWLAMPCCVRARWSVIYLSVAPVLLYLDPLQERFLWPSLVYLPAAALAVRELRQRTGPSAVVPNIASEGSV